MQGAPNSFGRQRHVNVQHTDGVTDCADHGGHRTHRARLTATLGLHLVRLTGDFFVGKIDIGYVFGARHRVIGEARSEALPGLCVVDAVFKDGLSQPLRDATMNLSGNKHRIDDPAEIVEHVIGNDLGLTGIGIDLGFADMATIGER